MGDEADRLIDLELDYLALKQHTEHLRLAQQRREEKARNDADWDEGIPLQSFAGGQYAVTVKGRTLTAVGESVQGYRTRVVATISVLDAAPPHRIRIDRLRVNP